MTRIGPKVDEIELPQDPTLGNGLYGSDIVAEALRDAGIDYVALTPGASFRGLQDSFVNYLGNRNPQILVCLHEEHAVAIAHGYAKAAGKPMAAALHSNVGLMHATMAIFNAWCDRIPILILGATGPVDAEKRRPWIEWIHTAADQGALVRDYVKWDDQPGSAAAARESVFRGLWLAQTAPQAPVYINLGVEMQEDPAERTAKPDLPQRLLPLARSEPGEGQLRRLVEMISAAQRPIFLLGRVSRDSDAWHARIALAEHFGARVLTDLKLGATFPSSHPLNAAPASVMPTTATREAIRSSDLVVSFDWVDLAGTLRSAWHDSSETNTQSVVQISVDHHLHNGWSKDHQAHPAVDLFIPAEPDLVVASLMDELPSGSKSQPDTQDRNAPESSKAASGKPTMQAIAQTLRSACEDRAVTLARLPMNWNAADWDCASPLDWLGGEGGAGIGAGPGLSVGAALALKDSGRIVIGISGDGDFIMGASALWTAVHYHLPLLYIVTNDQCFFNDEVHQAHIATHRARNVDNKWIGQRLTEPAIDIVKLAEAQGARGFGPVTEAGDLLSVLQDALTVVEEGGVAVVDIWFDRR